MSDSENDFADDSLSGDEKGDYQEFDEDNGNVGMAGGEVRTADWVFQS